MPFEKFDSLLPKSLNRAGAGRQVRAAMVLDAVRRALTETFGEETSAQVGTVKFKDGTVTLRCEEAVLTEELRLHEPGLIARTNEILGSEVVRKIAARS